MIPRELFDAHQGFALALARRYWRRLPPNAGVTRPELENAALVGLWRAAQRFDAAHLRSFQTFAYPRVWGEMADWLRTANGVRRRSQTPRVEQLRDTDERGEGGGRPMADALGHRCREMRRVDLRDEIDRALAGLLNRRDARMVKLYWLDGYPLAEAAAMVGLRESRASQILCAAGLRRRNRKKSTKEIAS